MNKQLRNKVTGAMLASVLAAAAVCAPAAVTWAASDSAAESQASTVYEGSNINAQNYSKWSSPIQSYLVPCADGRRMRVQYVEYEKKLVAEYYNTSYELESSRIIPQELPLFGGFYESGDYYFVLTGQENKDELPDVEVFRITKYDRNWNRIGSTGLKGANTVEPFAGGSARMDAYGKYLLIRTCHEMYKTEDGYNHQANVTIQLDMETMTITDSFTYITNLEDGYVSHSFNQFIKVENGHIIAMDHGDAYPRAIALIRYGSDVSGGKFGGRFSGNCTSTDILAFPGETGENATGASAGGFEISPTAYLVAGNSVIQDSRNLSRETRNVFVAAVDKSANKVNIHWLTDYSEGEASADTPHLVRISENRYMVLWSREDNVYYTAVDGNGKQTDKTYEIKGDLSDCVPMVADGRLVWYTWDDEDIVFYEIETADLSRTQVKKAGNTANDSASDNTADTDMPGSDASDQMGTDTDTETDADEASDTQVNVKKIRLQSVKSPSKGRLKATWKRDKAADGYQVAYSKNSSFSNKNTVVKTVSAAYGSKTFSGLTKGKTYYVRVRAYEKINGKTVYGGWSDVKKVKIKK